MVNGVQVRPKSAGCVIGLGLGRFTFVGRGVALLVAASLPLGALGAPQGAQVTAGKANIRQNGNTTIIRASNGAIIDYSRFDIGSNETVRFIQPNATSRVLNRVHDGASVINGTLQANGIVYIANSAGVFFGKGAFVDVGQIYAAAGTITNSDFLAGRDRFQNVQGQVINQGTIHASAAALIGDRVANEGAIVADRGVIAMVSGNDVLLTRRGDTMTVKVARDPANVQTQRVSGPGVENTGTLQARRGSALMAAGDMVSLAVRNTGTVQARDVKIEARGRGGVEVSGVIDASNATPGQRGGSVTITGRDVQVSNASIDASGAIGGGTIDIGGTIRGGAGVRRAETTSVDSSSTLRADARNRGDGGVIAVWSDTHTQFKGSASASGAREGDGGFIETSGKETIDFGGAQVLARAGEGGSAGTWLIDPGTITIDASAASAIQMSLEASMNVTVDTATGTSGPEDILFTAPIVVTSGSGGTLSLNAGNDINVSQSITAAGGSFNLSFNAGNDVTITAPISTGGGTVQSAGFGFTNSGPGNIATSGGSITLNHGGLVSLGAAVNASGGANTGLVSISATDAAITAAVSSGTLGSISILPALGTSEVRINNGSGGLDLSSAELSLLSTGSGGVLIGNASTPILIGSDGAVSQGYNISLTGSSITFNNSLTLTGASRTLTLNATSIADNHSGADVIVAGVNGTLSLNVSAAATLGTNVVSLGGNSAGASLTIDETNSLDLGTLSAGTLTVRAGGAISDSGVLTIGSGGASLTTLVNGGASITLDSPTSTFAGPVSLRSRDAADANIANGAITIVANSGLTLTFIQTGTVANVTANGDITSTNSIAVGSAANFTATGSGNISLPTFSGIAAISFDTSGASGAGNVSVSSNAGYSLNTSNIKGTLSATSNGATLTVSNPLTVGGSATLTARDLAINSTIAAGSDGIFLLPDAAAGTISINDPTVSDLNISNAELANLSTTGLVTIGRADGTGAIALGGSGAIDLSAGGLNKDFGLRIRGGELTFNGPLTLFDNQTLTLLVGGVVDNNMGVDVTIAGTGRLAIDAVTGVSLDTAIAELAVNAGSAINIDNTGADLRITSLGGISGATSDGDGTITLASSGTLTIDEAISTMGGVVLMADGDIDVTTMTAGITGESLVITSANGAISNGSGGAAKTAISLMDLVAPTITASAPAGINIENTGDVTATATTMTGDITFTNFGTLRIASGTSFSSNGNAITLKVSDLNLGGGGFNLDAGMGSVTISAAGPNGTIDLGDVMGASGELRISNDELATIRGASLTVGDTDTRGLTVRGLTVGAMMDIGALNLRALHDGGKVTLDDNGTASVFKTLDARANNGIAINKSFTVTDGALYLDGDADSAAAMSMPMDNITIADGVTFGTSTSMGGNVTLKATTGGITGIDVFSIQSNGNITLESTTSGGAITLTSNTGVTVNENLTSTLGGITISADADADGSGDFTLAAGKNITTTNNTLSLFAADIILAGMNLLDAGTGSIIVAQSATAGIWLGAVGGAPVGDLKLDQSEMTSFKAASLRIGSDNTDLMTIDGVDLSAMNLITGTVALAADDVAIVGALNVGDAGLSITRGNAGTIGVGMATGDMTISNSELAFITADRLTIGGGGASDIDVDGVAGSDVAGIAGAIGLSGTGVLSFTGAASTFQELFAAADSIVIDTDVTTSMGDLTFEAAGSGGVTIASGVTLTSGEDLAISAGDGEITGSGSLTLVAAKNITLSDPTTTNGVTTITADSDGDGSGVVTLADLDTTGNDLTITAAGLTLDGTIRAGGALTTIQRSADGTFRLGDFTKDTGDSPATFTLTGEELRRIVTGDLTLGGTTTSLFEVKDVGADQSRNVGGTVRLLAQAASGPGGDVAFSGEENVFGHFEVTALDAIRNTSNLASSESMTLTAGNTITTSDLTVLGPLVLIAGTHIQSNGLVQSGETISMTAGSTITSEGRIESLGGDIVLDAGLGASHIIRLKDDVSTTATREVRFKSAVELGAPVQVSGHDVIFESTVDSGPSGPRVLEVVTLSNGTTTFMGDVGSIRPLGQLGTGNDGRVRVNGDITAEKRILFGNDIVLTNHSTIESLQGRVGFGGKIDGNSAGTRDLTVLVNRTNPTSLTGQIFTIFFGDAVGSMQALRNLFLNYQASGPTIDGRTTVPPVATIIARTIDSVGAVPADPGVFNALFNVTGTFRMGKNEKLTSLGTLTINAGTAVLGDLTSRGDMTVNSPDIQIIRRPGARLVGVVDNPDAGQPLDVGVDYISGGVINFTSTPTLIGTGNDPEFGTPDGQRGPSAGTLAGFVFRQAGEISFEDLNFDDDFENGFGNVTSRALDLPASGPSSTDPSTTRARAIPRETRQNQVGQDTTISQATKDDLRNFNIYARDPSNQELLQLLSGGALYDDLPKQQGLRATAQDFTTVTTRLPRAAVEDLVAAYRATFSTPELDEEGRPILDPKTGKQKYTSRTNAIQEAIGKSVQRYMRGRTGDIDPSAFRAYIESTPEEAETRGYLDQIAEFIQKLDSVGLTPRELRQARTSILDSVRPKRLKPDVFEAIVRTDYAPSRG